MFINLSGNKFTVVSPLAAFNFLQSKSLATLSTDKIIRIGISEDVQVNPLKVKQPTKYFPCYATLMSEPTDINGLPRQGEKAYKKHRRRLDLYREPSDKSPLG